MQLRKIVVATDFSPGATTAVRVAMRIAKARRCPLEIVHALQVPLLRDDELLAARAGLVQVVEDLAEVAQHELQAIAMSARDQGLADVTAQLLHGDPQDVIVDVVNEDPRTDLVVVGTQGRTGMARVLAGSVAERVVRHAACSVLVVRPDSVPAPFRHVLCPIDFSESSRTAQRLAAAITHLDGTATTLLHVVNIGFPYTGRRPLDYVTLLERSAREALLVAASESKTMGSHPLRVRSAIGSPGGEVLAMLDADPSVDLVVTGSTGRTGVRRMLMGSVAEKVVRHARCPVLVARTRR